MKRKGIHSAEHKELVTLLSDMRHNVDMTQAEVAKALGRPQTYVSAVEVGRRGVDLLQVREFCAVYEVSFLDFVMSYEKRLKASTSRERPPRLSSRRRTASKKVAKSIAKSTAKSKPAKGTSKSK
jgi:transcriptional regulator with XRE-family HTH domain